MVQTPLPRATFTLHDTRRQGTVCFASGGAETPIRDRTASSKLLPQRFDVAAAQAFLNRCILVSHQPLVKDEIRKISCQNGVAVRVRFAGTEEGDRIEQRSLDDLSRRLPVFRVEDTSLAALQVPPS
jgi:hypothetical protein